jgi:hypothetical protein
LARTVPQCTRPGLVEGPGLSDASGRGATPRRGARQVGDDRHWAPSARRWRRLRPTRPFVGPASCSPSPSSSGPRHHGISRSPTPWRRQAPSSNGSEGRGYEPSQRASQERPAFTSSGPFSRRGVPMFDPDRRSTNLLRRSHSFRSHRALDAYRHLEGAAPVRLTVSARGVLCRTGQHAERDVRSC